MDYCNSKGHLAFNGQFEGQKAMLSSSNRGFLDTPLSAAGPDPMELGPVGQAGQPAKGVWAECRVRGPQSPGCLQGLRGFSTTCIGRNKADTGLFVTVVDSKVFLEKPSLQSILFFSFSECLHQPSDSLPPGIALTSLR